MHKLGIAFIFLVTIACSNVPEKPTDFEFDKGSHLAELTDEKLEEASGLASSITNPGYLWTHNDSNNGAMVFLIDKKLNIKMTCELRGVKNRDWEDIAVGPGPDPSKHYLYVGDIGDNMAVYRYKYIYRFEEPTLKEGVEKMVIEKFDTITFKLSDMEKDTEALLINPTNKNLYVVSKREEPVTVYELPYPYSTKDTITATAKAILPLTQITAGDFSPDGKEILLKNYQNVYYWNDDGNKSFSEILRQKPKILPYEEESQGEAITFARDGSGYYTLSEKVSGEKTFLTFYKRKK